MKSVLISIQPKWVEKIAKGEKTIEVRKSRPKLETPFKCYIYCTIGKGYLFWVDKEIKDTDGLPKGLKAYNSYLGNRSVIGEFVCDRIEEYLCEEYEWGDGDVSLEYRIRTIEGEKTCLDYDEIREYGNEKPLYFWHISDLKIYDKPKELSEFYSAKWDMPCEHKKRGFNMDFCMAYENGSHFCKECICDKKRLTQPPQSWCYVEGGI